MERFSSPSWSKRLQHERILRNWRQQDLADHLETTVVTIRRWERGSQQPSAYFRVKQCVLFGISAQELGLVEPAATSPGATVGEGGTPTQAPSIEAPSTLWAMPYPRNPFFTGRDPLLEQLHQQLAHEHRVAFSQSIVLSGLGGIGKTQTAIEYAYRHVHDCTAVFWIGAETAERLVSSFLTLAETLQLPEQQESEKLQVVRAVQRWLATHQGWLLKGGLVYSKLCCRFSTPSLYLF